MHSNAALLPYTDALRNKGGFMQPRIPALSTVFDSEDFKRHLRELNAICSRFNATFPEGSTEHVSSGENFKAEGSLFYGHWEEKPVTAPPEPARNFKSINYLFALNNKRHLLEIGFNAGHSALLALHAFPGLHYTAIDICQHGYTSECALFLSRVFSRRFRFLEGDSRDALPYLATHHADTEFDIFHVDGGHGHLCCRTDISNVIRLAKPGSSLLLDDAGADFIRNVFAEFEGLGYIARNDLGGVFHEADQLLATVIRRA